MPGKDGFFVVTSAIKSAAAAVGAHQAAEYQKGTDSTDLNKNAYFLGAVAVFAAAEIAEGAANYFWSARAKLGICGRYTAGMLTSLLSNACVGLAAYESVVGDGITDPKVLGLAGSAAALTLIHGLAAGCSSAPQAGYARIG
jgi:hypothetical protein